MKKITKQAKALAPKSPEQMTAIAHHEAGHVVAAHIAGRVIQDVSISSLPLENGEYGKSRHINPLYGQDIPAGDERLAELGTWELIISMAGPEAEKRIYPAREVPASDLATQEAILACVSNLSPSEIEEYVRGVKRKTRELVKQHWPAIERVAAALSARQPIGRRRPSANLVIAWTPFPVGNPSAIPDLYLSAAACKP